MCEETLGNFEKPLWNLHFRYWAFGFCWQGRDSSIISKLAAAGNDSSDTFGGGMGWVGLSMRISDKLKIKW